MHSTISPRHVVAVHATVLGAELRTLLRSFGYCPAAIADAVDFIGVHGTAEGSPADACDVEALNALVVKHTAHLEYDSAEDWPACYGSIEPDFVAEVLPPRFIFEIPATDRLWWTVTSDAEARLDAELDRLEFEGRALELMTRGLDPTSLLDPSRITDEDHAAVGAL